MNEKEYDEKLLRTFIWFYYAFPFLRSTLMKLYRMNLPKKQFPRLGEAPELNWSSKYIPDFNPQTETKNNVIDHNFDSVRSPKIVAMYKIKNEERWIKHSLESVSEICNEIVIFDNGSTDDTVKICKSFSKVVEIHKREPGKSLELTPGKNILLQMAIARNPDYILQMDGDEVLQPYAKNILFKELEIHSNASMFQFQYIHLWEKPNQYRYDGIYEQFWNSKLIKMSDQPKNLRYLGTEFPHDFHSPNLPLNAKGWHAPIKSQVKVLHYNIYDEEIRRGKYEYYTARDPNNKTHGEYKHLLGPYGTFSGPDGLELRIIPEGFYYKDIK